MNAQQFAKAPNVAGATMPTENSHDVKTASRNNRKLRLSANSSHRGLVPSSGRERISDAEQDFLGRNGAVSALRNPL
jgi:hypothetical protein